MPINKIIRIVGEGLSIWTGYSAHNIRGGMALFEYRKGLIVVKSPDKEILKKMYNISLELMAVVQGTESEIYNQNGEEEKRFPRQKL